MKKLRLIGLIWLIGLVGEVQAQTVGQEFDFVMYLVGRGMREDAVTAVKHTTLTGDSIDFLKGYTFYSARLLDSAALYLGRVGEGSPLFDEAMLFAALSNAHLGNYSLSEASLRRVSESDAQVLNLRRFEQAGVLLLERNMGGFDSCFSLLDTTDFRLSAEATNLLLVRQDIANHSRRSPWVAGTLSALVPGLGKVYAGNLGEGIAAFLVTGSLMAVTAENWIKEGPTNWKTIAAGLLSAVFYVGNIYGSVATVKVNLRDFNQRSDVQILYDIHIPLRASYRH